MVWRWLGLSFETLKPRRLPFQKDVLPTICNFAVEGCPQLDKKKMKNKPIMPSEQRASSYRSNVKSPLTIFIDELSLKSGV